MSAHPPLSSSTRAGSRRELGGFDISEQQPQSSSSGASTARRSNPPRRARRDQSATAIKLTRLDSSSTLAGYSSTSSNDDYRSYPTPNESPETVNAVCALPGPPGASEAVRQWSTDSMSQHEPYHHFTPSVSAPAARQTFPLTSTVSMLPVASTSSQDFGLGSLTASSQQDQQRLVSNSTIIDHGSPTSGTEEDDDDAEAGDTLPWPANIDPSLADWNDPQWNMLQDLVEPRCSSPSQGPIPRQPSGVPTPNSYPSAPDPRSAPASFDLFSPLRSSIPTSYFALRASSNPRTAPCPSTPSRGPHRPMPYSTPSRSSSPRMVRYQPTHSRTESDISSMTDTSDMVSLRSFLDGGGGRSTPDLSPSKRPVGGGTKKKSHTRKMSAGHVPRPQNAFILYRAHVVADPAFVAAFRGLHSNISKVVGAMWHSLSEEELKHWHGLAEKAKEEHARMFPNYKYKPRASPKKKKGLQKGDDEDGEGSTMEKGRSGRSSALEMMVEEDHEFEEEDELEVGIENVMRRSMRSSVCSRPSLSRPARAHAESSASSQSSARANIRVDTTDQGVVERILQAGAKGLQYDSPTSAVVARMIAVASDINAARVSTPSSTPSRAGPSPIVYDMNGDILVTPTRAQLQDSPASSVSSTNSSPLTTSPPKHTRLAGYGSSATRSSPVGSGGRPSWANKSPPAPLNSSLGLGRAPSGSTTRPPYGQGILASTSDPSQLPPTSFDTSLLSTTDRRISIGARWHNNHGSRLASQAERLAQQQELDTDVSSSEDQYATVRGAPRSVSRAFDFSSPSLSSSNESSAAASQPPWSAFFTNLDTSTNCLPSEPQASLLSPPSSFLYSTAQGQALMNINAFDGVVLGNHSTPFHLGEMDLFETPDSALASFDWNAFEGAQRGVENEWFDGSSETTDSRPSYSGY